MYFDKWSLQKTFCGCKYINLFIWRRSWQYLDVSGKFLLLKRNNRLKKFSLKIMCTTRWSNSRACQRLMKGDNCTSAYRATLSFQLSFLGSPSKLNPKWVHAMDSSMVTTRNLQLVHRDNASELSVVKARMRRIVEMCQSLLWSFEFCQKNVFLSWQDNSGHLTTAGGDGGRRLFLVSFLRVPRLSTM